MIDERSPCRVLIAGVGNLLRRDDGFGVEVARLLLASPPCVDGATVTIIETGIGGLHLVQELLSGYDALIIVDAVERDAEPGTLFILEPVPIDQSGWTREERRDFFADTHYAEPSHALALAAGVGALPPVVTIVGCQATTVDDLHHELSPAVARAVEPAIARIHALIGEIVTQHQASVALAAVGD